MTRRQLEGVPEIDFRLLQLPEPDANGRLLRRMRSKRAWAERSCLTIS